jgi:hypothetical protein
VYVFSPDWTDFRLILKALKKAGIIGVGACPELCRRVGDSGFLCEEICNLMEESGHQFIFAQVQHKQVKQRGKNAKNQRTAATQSQKLSSKR